MAMVLRYGIIDENVRKRSVEDVILHARQGVSRTYGPGPAGAGSRERGTLEYAGMLTVIRKANRLAADRIRAGVFSPDILLPPGTEETLLRGLVRQICTAAFPLGICVRDVCAEVTDAVTRPVVGGAMTGSPFTEDPVYPEGLWAENPAFLKTQEAEDIPFLKTQDPAGRQAEDPSIFTAKKKKDREAEGPACFKDQEILAAGPVGLEGTWILTAAYRQQLQKRFPESLLFRIEQKRRELCILRAAEAAAAAGAAAMAAPSGGGFFAGLWELSKKTGCGLEVDLQAVPILQETIEITDFFDIHPYAMRSAGCLLIAAPDGARMLRALREEGIAAVRIGRLQDKKEKILRNGEEVRYLDRPQTDALDLFMHENGPMPGERY